ncbi:hypothetical protein T261_07707 [Streptomyces lydicus]|nr:hypothetical protein T261_07707 [Streptomyces lydicus]
MRKDPAGPGDPHPAHPLASRIVPMSWHAVPEPAAESHLPHDAAMTAP